MFVPSEGIYHAALAEDPGPDRVRRAPAGADGHPDHADRTAARGPLRLAPGADRRIGARDRGVRARAAPAPRRASWSRWPRSGASSARPSAPTTRRSARSTAASCLSCAGSRRRAPSQSASWPRPAPVEAGPRPLASAGRSALEDLPEGEPILKRISKASATGTVAGSSSTAKNSRSNAIASSATSNAPLRLTARDSPRHAPAARRARPRRTGRHSPSRPTRTPRLQPRQTRRRVRGVERVVGLLQQVGDHKRRVGQRHRDDPERQPARRRHARRSARRAPRS